MLRKVRLYGQLAKFIGKRVLEADISSAAESVKFLIANFPGAEQHIAQNHYRVQVAGTDLALEEVGLPIGSDDVKIIPVIGGAGGKGSWKIIAGVALIGIAILAPGAGMVGMSFGVTGGTAATATTAAVGAGFWAGAAAFAGNIGIALVLSGVADMLTPTPKTPEFQDDPINSFSFSGVQQTGRAGTVVPVCYGEVLTGSVVISAELDVDQVQA